MKAVRLALYALVFACPLAGLAQSETGAIVLEESALITPPTSSWRYFGRYGVAIDGDGTRYTVRIEIVNGGRRVGGARHLPLSPKCAAFGLPLALIGVAREVFLHSC